MVALNLIDEGAEVSVFARSLAHEGIVITKCYKLGTCYHLKVSTRQDFDRTYGLVDWYVRRQFDGSVVSVNVGDFVSKGDLLFQFTMNEE